MVGDRDECAHGHIIYHTRHSKSIATCGVPDATPSSRLIRLATALRIGPIRVVGVRTPAPTAARALANPESSRPMPPPVQPATPISLFYSYAHKDEALRKKLETHLSLLQDQGVISGWHDRRIDAGSEWEGAISEKL